MLEILSNVVAGIVGTISARFTEKAIIKGKERRTIAARFIELFDSLDCIINTSKKLSSLIVSHAAGEVILRMELASSLTQLLDDVKRFGNTLSELESIIKIYDRELLVQFYDSMYSKRSNLVRLDLLTEIVPKTAAGYSIVCPTDFPRVKQEFREASVQQTSKYAGTGRLEAAWPAYAFDELRDRLLQKFNAKKFDLNIASDVAVVTASSNVDISRLEEARDALGTFIRTHLPLDRVLE